MLTLGPLAGLHTFANYTIKVVVCTSETVVGRADVDLSALRGARSGASPTPSPPTALNVKPPDFPFCSCPLRPNVCSARARARLACGCGWVDPGEGKRERAFVEKPS